MSYNGDDFENLGDLDIEGIAREELFKISIQFQTKWQDRLLDAGWKNTGEAINDITVEPQAEGSTSYTIGGDVIQLAISEFGRSPGSFPPPDAMGQWVHEQQSLPNKGDDEFDNVVFLVSRAVAENGIEPIMGGRNTWHELEGEYERRVSERVERELR